MSIFYNSRSAVEPTSRPPVPETTYAYPGTVLVNRTNNDTRLLYKYWLRAYWLEGGFSSFNLIPNEGV
jgi:hypothetical protein